MELKEFIKQGQALVEEISAQLRGLLVEPERDDLLLSVTVRGGELVAFLSRYGDGLGLEHLLAPVEAVGNVLEHAKFGYLQLSTQHVSLFMETCLFIEQGFSLITQEGNDLRLAASAAALEAALEESLHTAASTMSSKSVAFIGASNTMREAFFQESDQLLTTAEQEFVLWDFIAIDHQRVSELCRTLHRLKENFSIYDCQDFERLCMALESTLNRYMQGEFFQTEYPERTFLRCIDGMRESLSRFALTETLDIPQVEELLLAVQGLIRQPLGELLIEAGLVNPQTVDDALWLQRAAPASQPRRLGEVLVGMGEVSLEDIESVLDRQQRLQKNTKQGEALAAGGRESGVMVPLLPAEVSVDGQKLARVVSIVKQLVSMQPPEELLPFVQELDQLTQNMCRGVDLAFSHFLQRVVRDLSILHDKHIHFRLEGAEVMHSDLDMAGFSEILLPLLQNSVEHGIEPSEQRQRMQKKKHGRVTLSALRQGEELWISVEDDGIGFDLKKIARLCLEQELINQGDLGETTGAELLQIFLNNQNCAQKPRPAGSQPCTGLAVVKKMLQDYHAKMDIWSRPTKGARVTLRIPRPS